MISVPQPPSPAVLGAFGLEGPAIRLAGGQGTSWRVGEVVLKPGVDPQLQEWLGTVLARIEQRGFRLPTVLRAGEGGWVVQVGSAVDGARSNGPRGYRLEVDHRRRPGVARRHC